MSNIADIYNNQSSGGVSYTDRGTKIIKAGSDMDKNAFLKILAAELSNQDPTQNIDSTQYVTQLSQFSTMEQLQNLNSTLTNSANYSLVGKGCTVSTTDSKGVPYTGIIQAVNGSGSKATISMVVNENGTNVEKEFSVSDIETILEGPNYTINGITNITNNTSFLLGTSFIGKNVELSEKDSSDKYLSGNVIGVIREKGEVKARIKLDKSEEIITVSLDKITKVGEYENVKPNDNDSDNKDSNSK